MTQTDRRAAFAALLFMLAVVPVALRRPPGPGAGRP